MDLKKLKKKLGQLNDPLISLLCFAATLTTGLYLAAEFIIKNISSGFILGAAALLWLVVLSAIIDLRREQKKYHMRTTRPHVKISHRAEQQLKQMNDKYR